MTNIEISFTFSIGINSCCTILGSVNDLSLADARELTHEALRNAHQGNDPLALRQKEKTRRLEAEQLEEENKATNQINTALETYIGLHVKALSSGKEVERMLRHDVLPRWGNKDIRSITKGDILSLINAVKERGSATMANRLLANIRIFFNWAIANDYAGLTASPCQGVKPPIAETKRARVLTNNELRLLLLSIEELEIYWRGFFKLLAHTGCRRNEVAHATWSEFDFARNEWFLSENRTKNKRPHLIPLPHTVMAHLSDYQIEGCPYLFSSNGSAPISGFSKAKKQLDKAMAAKAIKLGVIAPEPWRIHDIRRTVATGMAGIGIQPHIVEAVLNHVSGAVSGVAGIYNRHGYYKEKQQALAAWARYIEEVRDGKDASNIIRFGS